MKEYWQVFSEKTTNVEMMLDPNAEALEEKDIPEIMSLLPGLRDKDILEIGAGIG